MSQPDQVPQVALVLVGIRLDAKGFAAVCRLSGVDAVCLASPVATVAVLADPTESAAHTAALALVKAAEAKAVVLVRRGPSDYPAAGDIQVVRVEDGVYDHHPAPGLFLSQMPDVVEDLLLGQADAVALGGVDSARLSTWAATRTLAAAARRAAKAARHAGGSEQVTGYE